jgi:hypothetical protein
VSPALQLLSAGAAVLVGILVACAIVLVGRQSEEGRRR